MRTGSQKPTFEQVGGYAYSFGAEVAEMFAEDGGATFYPCQEYELELMLARNEDGSPAGMTIGISKARQNGKSYSARFYAAYMSDFEHRNVLYSAHHSTTTNKMFRALCDLFDSPERFPDFAADVKKISRVRGYEGIYFKDWRDDDGNVQPGGCIEFSTRTNSGARGGTYSVIIIDEAQEMTAEQQEAMLPVISAASDLNDPALMPQQILVGTPPAPTCNGTVFVAMHEKAHSKDPGTTWWLEWALEAKTPSEAIYTAEDAIDWAYKTNPAMGYRIAEKTVLNEYENMTLAGFSRERLGWWVPPAENRLNLAIDPKVWTSCASMAPKPSGKTAYGVKFSADGSEVCLCGAVIPEDGAARIELIDRRPTGLGVQWLADWLCARVKTASCVVIDGRNGVDVLVDKIAPVWKYKDSVIRPTAKSMIAAVSMLTDALTEHTVTWYQPQTMLAESATTSVKRPISGGWGFGGENSAPIEACALAFWGAKTTRRNPAKAMRIG